MVIERSSNAWTLLSLLFFIDLGWLVKKIDKGKDLYIAAGD